ncbi:LuxR C-terminal-related transcriptional regulator [Solwaraspora sp. WMMD791]|uniref:helix-turn-helix transcriptional regulator n=1 Tax=Solwaraspora sp. WMMD791 TaxID=3016086 RepID=UPI00249AEA67|nr:LuxR C-terminal-related transcriptional regulator [Solwaraspora sp. WMMD791]WFE30109.1 LuxR C-terminal-related transcriptional regulator [Solwaraspora sp. WMMD791]
MIGPVGEGYPGLRAGTVRRHGALVTGHRLFAPPLVGRADVLLDLHRALIETASGAGGCIVVQGSAGIGKSRLLDAAAVEARALGMAVAVGRATALDRAAPLSTMRSLLQNAQPPGLDLITASDRGVNPLWLVDQIAEQIEQYVRRQPMLVCLDDAHLCDELTSLALRILVPELASSPLTWLLSRRPAAVRTFGQDAIDWLIGEGARAHDLEPLSKEAVTDFCASMLGAAPDDSVVTMAERGDGNPFLLEQLLSTLRDTGQLTVTNGVATLVGTELTADFLSAVDLRLRDLPELTRRILDASSVLGRPFTVHEVAGLVGRSAIELLPAIDEAVSAALLEADGTELRFRHDLIREALYGQLSEPVRRVLHREAATVVQREGRSAVEVAEHLVRGGHAGDGQALLVLRQAVAQIAPTAPNTAADLILRMLDLINQHDLSRPQLVAEAVRLLALGGRISEAIALGEATLHTGLDSAQEAALLLGLAEALHVTGHSGDVVNYASRGIGRARPGDPVRAELLSVQAYALLDTGDIAGGDNAGTEAAALGAATGAYGALVCGTSARSIAARMVGNLRAAVGYARDAVRIAEQVGGEARRRHPRLWLAAALTAVDEFTEAEALFTHDQRESDSLGTAWTQPRWYYHRATMLALSGRLDDAVAEAEAGARVAEQLAAPALSLPLLTLLASLSIHRDDLAGARDRLGRAHEIVAAGDVPVPADLTWTVAQFQISCGESASTAIAPIVAALTDDQVLLRMLARRPCAAPQLARLARAAGADSLAAATVETARQLARRNPDIPSLVGTAEHAAGIIHDDLGALRRAVHTLEQSPRVMSRAAAMEDLAAHEDVNVRRDDAVRLVEQALAIYLSCNAVRDAARAQKILRELGVRRRQRQANATSGQGWGSLTASELRVVRLVAEGLTNRQVAAQLFVSPHTVDSHLRHSFSKLGVTSRVELTRQVLLHDRAAGATTGDD